MERDIRYTVFRDRVLEAVSGIPIDPARLRDECEGLLELCAEERETRSRNQIDHNQALELIRALEVVNYSIMGENEKAEHRIGGYETVEDMRKKLNRYSGDEYLLFQTYDKTTPVLVLL